MKSEIILDNILQIDNKIENIEDEQIVREVMYKMIEKIEDDSKYTDDENISVITMESLKNVKNIEVVKIEEKEEKEKEKEVLVIEENLVKKKKKTYKPRKK